MWQGKKVLANHKLPEQLQQSFTDSQGLWSDLTSDLEENIQNVEEFCLRSLKGLSSHHWVGGSILLWEWVNERPVYLLSSMVEKCYMSAVHTFIFYHGDGWCPIIDQLGWSTKAIGIWFRSFSCVLIYLLFCFFFIFISFYIQLSSFWIQSVNAHLFT